MLDAVSYGSGKQLRRRNFLRLSYVLVGTVQQSNEPYVPTYVCDFVLHVMFSLKRTHRLEMDP